MSVAILVIDAPPTYNAIIDFVDEQLAWGLFLGTSAFLFYLAVEPFVRRRWPEILISWSRLVMGDLRDPMIGRDILIGAVFGVVVFLTKFALAYIQFRFDPRAFVLLITNTETDHLMGTASALSDILDKLRVGLIETFGLLFLVLVTTLIFRKRLLGITATFLIFVAPVLLLVPEGFWAVKAYWMLWDGLVLFLLVRFGVVSLISFFLLDFFLFDTAFTLDSSSFYFPSTVLMSATVLALAGYAYYVSLAGNKIFGDSLFGE